MKHFKKPTPNTLSLQDLQYSIKKATDNPYSHYVVAPWTYANYVLHSDVAKVYTKVDIY